MPANSILETGSVRVDLVGGTLDIHPIQLILPNCSIPPKVAKRLMMTMVNINYQ